MEIGLDSEIVVVENLSTFFEVTHQDDLHFLDEDIDIFFWAYVKEKNMMYFTPGIEKIYGYTSNEILKANLWHKLIHPESKEIEQRLFQAISEKKSFELEYRIIQKDGSVKWLFTKAKSMLDTHGNQLLFTGFTQDISSKKFAEMELAESASKYQTLVENNAQAVYIAQNAQFQYVNKKMSEMTGYTQNELLGMSYDQILDAASIAIVLKRVNAFLCGEGNETQELNIVKKDGSKIIVELRSALITYKNEPALMGTLLDVTEKKHAQNMVHQLAYFDTLTSLPNRNSFHKNINAILIEAEKENNKIALLFIDLDKFKIVNDTYGYHVGDILIKEAAVRLKQLLDVDKGFIARYGGDEFVAVLEYENLEAIERKATEIIQEVPLALSTDLMVVPSIGISLFPEHGKDAELLLKFADTAMYQSKQDTQREVNYCLYVHSMSQQLLRVNKLTKDLRKAVELNQFYLMYQPKIGLKSFDLEGVEALLRWEHPEFGNVSPAEFIPMAEKSGQVNAIGNWVLEEAIRHIKTIDQPLMLNVNISTGHLLQEAFIKSIKNILDENGYPGSLLNLEITESVALYDINKTIDILNQLKDLNVKISMDDFGTGYSSLSYLSKLPIDYLKIDRSFIKGMEHTESQRTITKAAIEVAHNLKMSVVAEGVETEEQLNLLVSYGCDIGQGYLFSKPLLFVHLLTYIKEYNEYGNINWFN